MIKKISALLFAAALVLMTAFPVFAEDDEYSEDSYYSEDESSAYDYDNSYDEESSYDEDSYESSYYDDEESSDYYEYSGDDESSYDESTYYTADEEESSEQSSEEESSYESSGENSADEESEASKAEESSSLKLTDPFAKLRSINYILPSDDPNYVAKQKKEESNHAAGAVKHNSGLLDAPPIPLDDTVSSIEYSGEDDGSSVLIGIIFWSVIGIVLTIVLIFIINLKGSGNDNFARKRYDKKKYRPVSRSVSKYNVRR